MQTLTETTRLKIIDGIRKYARIVSRAKEMGISEADTHDLVRAMLGDMLGYDPFFDVTSEGVLRGPHATFMVLNGTPQQFLIVVQPLTTTPHAAHLLRLSGVNTPNYTSWAILTNGDTWACYRLGVGTGRSPEQVFRVSLSDSQTIEARLALFSLLSKEGVHQDSLATHWEQHCVLNPVHLTALLLLEETLQILRRELQRYNNYRIDTFTLRQVLEQGVLRPEIVAQSRRGGSDKNPLPQCYAYTPDVNSPSTWRLRIRNADGTPNPEWLTQALGELQGEHRILGIPADDVPYVKERLRNAFLELGVALNDLPRALRY